jgi:hypothetical protein
MNSELARIRDRLNQQRDARNQQIADALERARQALRASGGVVLAGDRVFDPETGQRGTVIATTTEVVHVPAPERADG